ncbi:hypothetical protein [Flavobacterium sp. FlaQc-50]|uniref:hypothetical protein n=1 Tax=unclassified Flavobacterium TaxID=196869 RepID=UPI0037584E26
MLKHLEKICSGITMDCFGTKFKLRIAKDQKHTGGRFFIQVTYTAKCNKTGKPKIWHGRKWYLSEFMTDDEVVKTAYCAFEAVVKHEIMEGFKINGIVLFNPHVDYLSLLKVSNQEVSRNEIKA